MAVGGQIAEVFTKIGFKVDFKDLKKLDKFIANLKKDFRGLQKAMSINPTVNATGLSSARKQVKALKAEIASLKGKTVSVGVNTTRTGGGGFSRASSANAFGGAALGSNIGQFTPGVGLLGAGIFGGVGIVRASQQMEAIRAGLLAAAGGAEEGRRALSFMLELSDKLGISFKENTRAYQNFLASSKAVNLATQESEEIFTAFASAGRTLSLSTADLNGVMKAVTQILSKGVVSSEELRQQLGERLPGAVGLMAKALGVTVPELNKMLELGQVISKDALPKMKKEVLKFAKTGGALDKAMDSNLANMERMKNAFFVFQAQVGESHFMDALTETFVDLTVAMSDSKDEASALGSALTIPLNMFRAFLELLPVGSNLLERLPSFLKILAVAVGLLALPFVGVTVAVGGLLLVLSDLVRFFTGKSSFIGNIKRDFFGQGKFSAFKDQTAPEGPTREEQAVSNIQAELRRKRFEEAASGFRLRGRERAEFRDTPSAIGNGSSIITNHNNQTFNFSDVPQEFQDELKETAGISQTQ